MNRPPPRLHQRADAPAGRRPRAVLTLALVTTALVAGGATASSAVAADTAPTAWVRATHLVPGIGAVTVTLVPFAGVASGADGSAGAQRETDVPPAATVDGARVLEPAATYGGASDYRQVQAGVYSVQLRPAGASPANPPLLSGVLDAKADQAYTLAPLGTKEAPTVQVLADDLTPPQPGTARVRLISAASRARR
jgi:hypothetical protein